MNQTNWWSKQICPLPSTEGSLIKSSEDSWFTLINFIPRFSKQGEEKFHTYTYKKKKTNRKDCSN